MAEKLEVKVVPTAGLSDQERLKTTVLYARLLYDSEVRIVAEEPEKFRQDRTHKVVGPSAKQHAG